MLLAVSDIEAARSELIAHGVDASQLFHCETGTACRFSCIGARVTGPQFEPLSVADDGALAANRAKPGEQFQQDLGHPGVSLVFWFWQCAKKNHGRCEDWP